MNAFSPQQQQLMDRTGLMVCRTMDAFCRVLDAVPEGSRIPYSSWAGGSFTSAVQDLKRGAPPWSVRRVQELIERIDAGIQDRTRREYVRSPVGAFPVVAEVLQGDPMHMRRRVHVVSELAPVKVVCEVGVEAGVNNEAVARRGAAVAALVMRLSETRPVELWAVDSARVPLPSQGWVERNYDAAFMIKIDTTPISISQLAAVFVEVSFARAISLSVSLMQAGSPRKRDSIEFCWGFDPLSPMRNRMMRAVMGLTDDDIYIPGGPLSGVEAYMTDPVGWVHGIVNPQRELE